MRDFLLIVAAFKEYYAGSLKYDNLRERLAELGLRDYLINDGNEWVALPDNMYAAWVKGDNSDAVMAEWNQKLGSLFGSGNSPGAFFVSVGADAVWQAQVFE
jgi:hypothetical protein